MKPQNKKIILIVGIMVLILVVAGLVFLFWPKICVGPCFGPAHCDAQKKCPSDLVCVKFPNNNVFTCYPQELIDNYPCPNGTIKNIIKTRPMKIECENIVGGDTDEHGCIGSAGYSWCETKQKCLRVWEEECFVCPEEKSVNCQPIIDTAIHPERIYCEANYRQWIKENCDTTFLD